MADAYQITAPVINAEGNATTLVTVQGAINSLALQAARAVNAIAAAGGTGTVTSVNVSGGATGLTTSGGPITGAGTITVAGTLAIANGGTNATTVAGALTNLNIGTVASQAANAVAITGGTVDNTAIGNTTPAAGTFSTLKIAAKNVQTTNNAAAASVVVPTAAGTGGTITNSTAYPATVVLSAGTAFSAVTISRGAISALAGTTVGQYFLAPGDVLTLVYTAAPTATIFPQ